MYLFDSAALGIPLPPAPPIFKRAPWLNMGTAREASYTARPQGVPLVDGDVFMADFEPTPTVAPRAAPGQPMPEPWGPYDCAEEYARAAATVAVRFPRNKALWYGLAPITGAQADPAKKRAEDAQLAKLDPMFALLGRLGAGLVLDVSMSTGQSAAAWQYATRARVAKLAMVFQSHGVTPSLVFGVRRVGGTNYENTEAHTDADLVQIVAEVKFCQAFLPRSATVAMFAHYTSTTFAADGASALATVAKAWGGLKPKPGVPTVGGPVAVAVPGPGVGGPGGGV